MGQLVVDVDAVMVAAAAAADVSLGWCLYDSFASDE